METFDCDLLPPYPQTWVGIPSYTHTPKQRLKKLLRRTALMSKCQHTRFQNLHSYDTAVPLLFVFSLNMNTYFESLSITSEFPPQGREDGGSVSPYPPLDSLCRRTISLGKQRSSECRQLLRTGSAQRHPLQHPPCQMWGARAP